VDIPPKNNDIGETCVLDHNDNLKIVFSNICSKSSISSSNPLSQNKSSFFLDAYISLAYDINIFECSLLFNSGR